MDRPEEELPGREELEQALKQSPRLRALARRALKWLGRTLERIDEELAPAGSSSKKTETPLQQVTLKIGGAAAPVEVPQDEIQPSPRPAISTGTHGESSPVRQVEPVADLTLVANRARLKEEACLWAIQRRKRLAEGADFEEAIRPKDRELARRVRELPDCYAWPLDPYAKLPSDSQLGEIAASYECLATAADLVLEVSSGDKSVGAFAEMSYQLLAEAQSALRAGLVRYAEIDHDRDQDDAFRWLRLRTYQEHTYVPRFMRLDDPADPKNWHDLQMRLEELHGRFHEERRLRRHRRSLFHRIRYHLDPDRTQLDDGLEDWQRVDQAVGNLLESGLPPSNVKLRDLLSPALDRMPVEFEPTPGLAMALREIDRFLASREKESSTGPAPALASREVQSAASLLKGGRIVLIGGEERPRSRAALEKALELAELRWITTSPGESYTVFEPEIARPETTLVLLAIRWASHSYENVKHLCDRYGKPYVRLPAGYSPNQVAEQVLRQASDRLASAYTEASKRT